MDGCQYDLRDAGDDSTYPSLDPNVVDCKHGYDFHREEHEVDCRQFFVSVVHSKDAKLKHHYTILSVMTEQEPWVDLNSILPSTVKSMRDPPQPSQT